MNWKMMEDRNHKPQSFQRVPPPCQARCNPIPAHAASVSDSSGVAASGRILPELPDDGRQAFPYVYRNRLRILWGGKDSPYFGRRCQIVTHNRPKNTRMVEFENGEIALVSGNALRKYRPNDGRRAERAG